MKLFKRIEGFYSNKFRREGRKRGGLSPKLKIVFTSALEDTLEFPSYHQKLRSPSSQV